MGDLSRDWRIEDDGYVSVSHVRVWHEGPPLFVEAVLAHNETVWEELHGRR